MARLILKSPYLKCGGNNSVSGYLRYIGTRERVELLPDDRPPTRKQEQLVRKLIRKINVINAFQIEVVFKIGIIIVETWNENDKQENF